VCSNARRTRQTLEGIKSLLPANIEIVFDDGLYKGEQKTIWDIISEVDSKYKGIILIAHNPGLSQAVQWIADVNGRSVRQLPTSGVAICSTKSTWNDLSAPKLSLDEFITP
jgi:phosphohistidine phosphatase